MSMKLVPSSGSYNVRASEMAHLQDRTPRAVNCAVHFLDDTVENFEVDVSCTSCICVDSFDNFNLLKNLIF